MFPAGGVNSPECQPESLNETFLQREFDSSLTQKSVGKICKLVRDQGRKGLTQTEFGLFSSVLTLPPS